MIGKNFRSIAIVLTTFLGPGGGLAGSDIAAEGGGGFVPAPAGQGLVQTTPPAGRTLSEELRAQGCYVLNGRLVCGNDNSFGAIGNGIIGNGNSFGVIGGFGQALDPGLGGGPIIIDGNNNLTSGLSDGLTASDPDAEGPGRATRIFGGPGMFPPPEFAAYGIVVFKSLAVDTDRRRHVNACKGYVSAILTPGEADVPRDRQLVTVWPVDDVDVALTVMEMPRADRNRACALAVDRYGLAQALEALAAARVSKFLSEADRARVAEGRGPFLFAWSPARSKGSADALILRADLSGFDSELKFRKQFEAWRDEVEARQDLWIDGWNEPSFWQLFGAWADRWGEPVLGWVGKKEG